MRVAQPAVRPTLLYLAFAFTWALPFALPAALIAEEHPLNTAAVREMMDTQPLSEATWPVWREYYVRLHYDYEANEPVEFYDTLRDFLGEQAKQHDDSLPGIWAQDPVAWTILSTYHKRSDSADLSRAIADCRQALALGDPEGISSYGLASVLIQQLSNTLSKNSESTAPPEALVEIEKRLDEVDRQAPTARLSFYRGLVASFRGETKLALTLLRQGVLDHPHRAACATTYLAFCVRSPEVEQPLAEISAPLVAQFPDNAQILIYHVLALNRDKRFADSYAALEEARQRNPQVDRILGPEMIQNITDGRWLTPEVQQGAAHLKELKFNLAISDFEAALKQMPKNVIAARLLTRALFGRLKTTDKRQIRAQILAALQRCETLSQTFPDDPELQVAYAVALRAHGQTSDSNRALQRAQDLGADMNEFLTPKQQAEWRRGKQMDEAQSVALQVVTIAGVGFLIWVALMFLMGFGLAFGIPRTPDPQPFFQETGTQSFVWRTRFYLLILSLCLVVFYLSVPFVALGLLAITLALFGLCLAFRVLHIGILYRGWLATWWVIRGVFVGAPRDVVGLAISADQHPQFFDLVEEVADQVGTAPVEKVYLTPDVSVGVREQGVGPFGLFRRKRVLEVGMSALSALTTSEFRAVLAHEYGHFSHQDTFYSRFISQVNNSLAWSLGAMNAAAGGINHVNPFFWFYWLYLRAYGILASGFSRSREFLADRCALQVAGRDAFISSLTKIAVHGTLFDATASNNVLAQLRSNQQYINLFASFRDYLCQPESAEQHNQILDVIRSAKPSLLDSHPTYQERIALAHEFPETTRFPADEQPAQNLLTECGQLEEQLTQIFTMHIARLAAEGA
ncbi:MAG: M48 family metalloprotease [Planctomycetes bacterium]|nr:M48 family metalloprotease [Planctomycetota bacterium]